jgi:ABC-type Fe3+-siderophore transport system permease subunit
MFYFFIAGAIVGIVGAVIRKVTKKPVKKVYTITVPASSDKYSDPTP